MQVARFSTPDSLIFSVVLTMFLIFAGSKTEAQVQGIPHKVWDKTFGGNYTDWLKSFQQTSDGGYILGGTSRSDQGGDKSFPSKGTYDFWVIKTDDTGNKLWDKVYGGNDFEQLAFVHQTADGGYFLGGTSQSSINEDRSQPSRGEKDIWVVKVDAAGIKQWDKAYGGSNDDWLATASPTQDGGYILAGYSSSGISGEKTDSAYGDSDFWIVKIDAFGNKEWDKRLGKKSGLWP